MVVEEILGVVKVFPVPKDTPPVEAAYQLIVPALAVAPKSTVPVEQWLPVEMPVIVGVAVTVATTPVREEVVHPLAVAST